MAEVWAADAALAYGPLARHLVGRAGPDLRGCLALDAGAGSGVAGDALRAAGARVVAVDLEVDMVRHGLAAGPALAADVTALPFRDSCFDLAVAAFVVNHLEHPVAGLVELRRITRPGGTVLVSVFSTARSAAKTAVDEVAGAYGYIAPDWYRQMQQHARTIGTVEAMTRALQAAGFTRFGVTDDPVDVGLRDPALIVRYRTGMAQMRPFVAGLSPGRRRAFLAEAAEAVARTGGVLGSGSDRGGRAVAVWFGARGSGVSPTHRVRARSARRSRASRTSWSRPGLAERSW
jgi:ubiquinone/menaquinone biosynthesis C-methylase UbiE